jgi:hypothetical protein
VERSYASTTSIYNGAVAPGAQNGYDAGQPNAARPHAARDRNENAVLAPGQVLAPRRGTATAHPVKGMYLLVGQNSAVREVSAGTDRVELRVERGLANVTVHDPAHHSLLLVDLPGGQVSLLKDGLYTFNAQTNTVRVLHGEAAVFPPSAPNAKPVKVKENHELAFEGNGTGERLHPESFDQQDAMADLIPPPYNPHAYADSGYGDGGYAPNGAYYGGYYGPYDDGFYGYPYYALAYGPWGWYYPWGWYGYPGFGLGFGYYGGFGGYRGYGYRGGYGGFHGGYGGHAGGFGGGGHVGGGGGRR